MEFPFADVELARRLETAESRSSTRFADSRARQTPGCGACWMETEGALAIFDGPTSPVTQTFCLGIQQAPTADGMARLEAFFHERGAPVYHEVSPLAYPSTFELLNARGYQPCEFTSVLYRPIVSGAATDDPAVVARLIAPGEEDLWAHTAAEGWSETAGLGDFMRDLGRVSSRAEGARLFFAEADGRPIATGIMYLSGGIAHLAGASTIRSARKRGAQSALLSARLRTAAALGCDLAMMGALPGSGSQRNAERNGFRIAYTRVKWVRNPSPGR
jgi:hypothetical protein